jgi:phage terminase small subunit
MGKDMNARQRRFVQHYLLTGNATQAAISAGYSEATAKQQGSRLLTNADIAAAIADAESKTNKKLADKFELSKERVVGELVKLGFANMDDFVRRTESGDVYTDFSAVNRDQMAAVQEIVVDEYKEGRGEDARDVKRVRFKLGDKRAALVDLGKHLGLFATRVEHSGPGGGPIKTENTTTLDASALDPEDRQALRAALLSAKGGKDEE